MFTIEYIGNLWENIQKAEEDKLTYNVLKLYLDKLERYQGRLLQIDDELMEFKDLVSDYYKRKVISEAVVRYATIKTHISGQLRELEPQDTSCKTSNEKIKSKKD